MNRNNFWRFVLVVLVILWSLYELYPPEGRDLRAVLPREGGGPGPDLYRHLPEGAALQKAMPEKPYDNLVGGHRHQRHHPLFPVLRGQGPAAPDDLHPEPLAARSRRPHPAGPRPARRHLVPREMDTNRLAKASDASTALSHAVEVLRKRVDKFGVAEPLIQPEGNDRILVQLPGLSAADQESAKVGHSEGGLPGIPPGQPDQRSGHQRRHRPARLRNPQAQGADAQWPGTHWKRSRSRSARRWTAAASRAPWWCAATWASRKFTSPSMPQGAERFAEITRENVHQRLAIILDRRALFRAGHPNAHRDRQRPDHRPVRQPGSLRAGQRAGKPAPRAAAD